MIPIITALSKFGRIGFLAAYLLVVHSTFAVTLYVDCDATGVNNGSSWPNAYTSLQTAIGAAGSGTEIWVADGTYKPGAVRTDAFQLRANVSLLGGYNGTETLRSQRNWTNYIAVLSGDIGTPGDPSDNVYHVLKGLNGAVLDGFTITGGRGGTNWPSVSGAGMFNSNASPVIANCRFIDNVAYFNAGNGGAIFNLNSSPVISNCTFSGNSAYWGGAICNLNGGTVTVLNCEFTTNSADIGGAVNNENAMVILRDCRFIGNTGDGGGVNNRGCAPAIINCVFAQNNAGLWQAGGLRNVAASPVVQNALFVENCTIEGDGAGAFSFKGAPQYVNCTFYGNSAELGAGGAIFNDSVAGATLKNSILWNNIAGAGGAEVYNFGGTITVSFCDIEGGLNGSKCGGDTSANGGGNLAVSPFFVSVTDLDGPDNRYATADDGLQLNALLSGSSPCIDVASTNGAPRFDLVNLTRPRQYGVDIGAYEYNPDYDGDGLDNLLEYRIGSNAKSLNSDGDEIPDGVEYYTYGTSPILSDTDGDGMPDGWEIAYGLNPFVNDAAQDRDLDWVTNLQEYQNGLNPLLADSNSDGTNDYYSVLGKSGARYTYDRIDRLSGVEYERGFSIAYVYDGNGNLSRQYYLQRDQDGDGLPDLWEFQNGLSWTNGLGAQGLTGDTDGDGWSNIQELQGGSDPSDPASRPDIFGVASGTTCVFRASFAATQFTMASGQLDNNGGDKVVVGADGNPGTITNALIVLTQSFSGWTTQRVDVGSVGVTSIAIGQPTNTTVPAIYVGTRKAGGNGTILRVAAAGNAWTKETLIVSTNESAYVLGVRFGRDVLVSLARSNEVANGLASLVNSNGTWQVTTLDTNRSSFGIGTIGFASGNDTTGGGLRLIDTGGIQLAPSNAAPVLVAEPASTEPLLWTGRSLASGSLRSVSASICYQYIEDANSSGGVDAGDRIVLYEAEINGTNWVQRTLQKTTMDGFALSPTYSLACVNLTNGTGRTLFTAEPDGGIYVWSASSATGELARTAYSLHRLGKAWHDLSAYRSLSPGEGMVGLNVDPAAPTLCNVVIWPPVSKLWTPASISQTAPKTCVLAAPNRGAGLSLVNIRVWDAEGNRALPFLQYQDPLSSQWKDATIMTLDGQPYSYSTTVEATPSGVNHTYLWDSGHDLGTSSTNNVLLRSRSVDITLWGDWSEPVMYRVEGTLDSDNDGMPDAWELANGLEPLNGNGSSGPDGDLDGDKVSNIDEYKADTNPRDGASYLTITGVRLDPEGVRVEWKGGIQAWQFIQVRESLSDTNSPWTTIQTVNPPTPVHNLIIDAGATNATLFYRIKAER